MSVEHGFGVRNLTTLPMFARGSQWAFSGIEPRFGSDAPAADGELIPPAHEDFFKMTWWVFYSNGAYLDYELPTGRVTMKATVDPWDGTPRLSCFTVHGPFTCEVSGESAFIRSSTVSQRIVEASQQQEQADALKALCDVESPHLSCVFEPKGDLVQTIGQGELKGDYEHYNCKAQTLSRYSFTWGLEQGTSQSVGGSFTIGATIKKVIEVSVSVTYSETWSWTSVTQESHAADIAPGYWTWVEQWPGRLAVTGDFTAVIGNDTVIMRDVTFEAPHLIHTPEGIRSASGYIGSNERIMLPAERVKFCHETPEVAQRRYELVLAASPDGAAEVPGTGDPVEVAAADAPAFTDPDEIAAFEDAFEAAG